MPRIGRGSPASSPLPEHTDNATPPRRSYAGGGSAAGRPERHGLLSALGRPFRGLRSSSRAPGNPSANPLQEREPAPVSRAAPRSAAALLQRSPVLSRGHGEAVMARIERAPANTPGADTQGAPSRAPARAALTPQPAPETQTSAQVSRIVQQFRDSGVDLDSMARALEQQFPVTTRERVSPDHALAIELCRALRLAVSESDAALPRLTMPEPVELETVGQYAWRVRNLNPTAPIRVIVNAVTEIAAAVPGESEVVRLAVKNHLEATIKTRDSIVAAFGALRPISKTDANRMGFKDAATHDEDEATDCLFGGALSTGNSDQRVIGLAQVPSNPNDAYSAGVNKDLVFMDLNKLAEHLASNPTHPVNRRPLNPSNIHQFAFRLE